MQLVVKPVAGAENGWLKPGQSVVLDEVVSHGPLPLAQLKSFNLIPSMTSPNRCLTWRRMSRLSTLIPELAMPVTQVLTLP
jgi:uncharacterized protein YdgA (DUF945 family)